MDPSGVGPLLRSRTGAILIALALTLAALGHAAWWVDVDTSARPFLPQEAAEAKGAVTTVFPNATPPTVRVVVEAHDGANVLSPDALTALAGLRNRISSDPLVAPLLSRGTPLESVLTTLEPHLEGRPGEWGQAAVDAALEDATATAQGRRGLAGYLDTDARIDGAASHAEATALVVRLAATASDAQLETAQERIRVLADDVSVAGLTVATDAPALQDEAAHHPLALWAPLGAVVLVPLGALAAGARPRRLPRWLGALLASAGAGLLAGSLLGHASPVSLSAAYLGAGAGLVVLIARGAAGLDDAPGWILLLPVAPLAAMAGWAAAGVGALATVATVASLVPLLASLAAPDALTLSPRWRLGAAIGDGSLASMPALAGPVSLGVILLVLVATAGLPATAVGGWHGTLPPTTEAGRAAGTIETRFGGTGPGAELAIAAWGRVEEPGFLAAVDETGQRLDRLTLAATGGSVQSILAVARDWSTNDTARDPSDRYDRSFARAWNNATNEDGVPVRNVSGLIGHLHELDPDATRAHLLEDPDGRRGVALVRQSVSLSDVVPRPSATVTAALQPLVAASDRVAEGGNALDDARAEAALEATAAPVIVALLAAAAAAGAAYLGRARQAPGLGLTVGVLAGLSGASLLALISLAGQPLRPGALVASGATSAIALAVALPATARGLEDQERPGPSVATWLARVGLPAGLVLVAVLIPLATTPASGLRVTGLALAAGLTAAIVALGLGLPGIVAEAGSARREPEPTPGEDETLPSQAHTVCPSCQRSTATAAERCPSCGRWNLREACPAHPTAIEASCAACGTRLTDPRFR